MVVSYFNHPFWIFMLHLIFAIINFIAIKNWGHKYLPEFYVFLFPLGCSLSFWLKEYKYLSYSSKYLLFKLDTCIPTF